MRSQQLQISDYQKWPLPIKVILITTICLLLFASSYYLCINNLQKNLSYQNQQLSILMSKLKTPYIKLNSKKLSIKQYQQQLQHTPKTHQFIQQMSQLTQQNLLQLKLLHPEGEITEKETSLKLQPISVVLEGQYQNLINFLKTLTAKPYFINIHGLSLTKNNQHLTLDLMLILFYASEKNHA